MRVHAACRVPVRGSGRRRCTSHCPLPIVLPVQNKESVAGGVTTSSSQSCSQCSSATLSTNAPLAHQNFYKCRTSLVSPRCRCAVPPTHTHLDTPSRARRHYGRCERCEVIHAGPSRIDEPVHLSPSPVGCSRAL